MGTTRLALARPPARTPRSLTAGRGWGVGVAAVLGGPGRRGGHAARGGAGRTGVHPAGCKSGGTASRFTLRAILGRACVCVCVHPSRGGELTQSHTVPGISGVAAGRSGYTRAPLAARRSELSSRWLLASPEPAAGCCGASPGVPDPWKVRTGSSPCWSLPAPVP